MSRNQIWRPEACWARGLETCCARGWSILVRAVSSFSSPKTQPLQNPPLKWRLGHSAQICLTFPSNSRRRNADKTKHQHHSININYAISPGLRKGCNVAAGARTRFSGSSTRKPRKNSNPLATNERSLSHARGDTRGSVTLTWNAVRRHHRVERFSIFGKLLHP